MHANRTFYLTQFWYTLGCKLRAKQVQSRRRSVPASRKRGYPSIIWRGSFTLARGYLTWAGVIKTSLLPALERFRNHLFAVAMGPGILDRLLAQSGHSSQQNKRAERVRQASPARHLG